MKYLQTCLPFLVASIMLFGNTLRAEFFSISAGVPLSHDIADENISSDGVSGYFFHVKFPILVGVGLENYETKIKDSTTKIGTTMYDIFYLLPIPIINLTVGLGAGETELLLCTNCSSNYDKGTATQFYTSLGIPFLGIMDAHLSYRSVNSTIKAKSGSDEYKTGGNVIGAGISIGF
ncbi:MAG: hypothetical protein VX399_08440 [SAR324 cluster bacterium]|nr:hypothetical protein [SAR324 cluster bacterium]